MNTGRTVNEYLKRLKNGERCLKEFFNTVSGCVNFIAYRYLADKSYAEDVVMNTLCNVLDNIQQFDESKNGLAWICKIAQNEAYKINNREAKHAYVSFEELSEELACASDEYKTVDFMCDLERAMNKLDKTDRQITEMRLIADMTYNEIADELNMSVAAVCKHYKKSVKEIGEFLK